MGMMSKRKGKSAENEAAKLLSDAGFPARRGQQFCGSPDSPDVVCESLGFHIEVKRCEKLSLYKALEQAQSDAGDKPAVVFHRRNRKLWVVILDAEDFLKIVGDRS
jgi:hypothetical protein